MGNVNFNNIMTADCAEGGIDVWDTSHGTETSVTNSVVVGKS